MDRLSCRAGMITLAAVICLQGCLTRTTQRVEPMRAPLPEPARAPAATVHLPVAEMRVEEEIFFGAPGMPLEKQSSSIRTVFVSYPADVPARAAPIDSVYTVKVGDDLQSIARVVYGDCRLWRAIFDANQDVLTNPDEIIPGQQLKLP
ncbi:MAG: LysM peptidoglycan-binding domain-containing protein [Candidatus Omnitrophica bacterium]|nr:LysM peptidoglycan-binding domain-containing protein [Candidatus Omnitrophota bacterium]